MAENKFETNEKMDYCKRLNIAVSIQPELQPEGREISQYKPTANQD